MADRIRIKDVAKTFLTSGRPLLVGEGIDLAVAEGEFVALVGPSGCGKTTLFSLDVPVCDRCGGPRRILGAVTEPNAVRRLLAVLGLAAEPPPGPLVSAA
jgi:ABC-type nitrate/sulfonate/bicarbonate transport system ATPase subunit